MSNQNVRPNAMSRFKHLEEEERFLSSLRKSARRVKIDDNHTWQLRILPYENTVDGQPYVRLAQHWWNNAPITCPTHTPKAWGGDPEHLCPVCELAERLNESSDEGVRNVGYRAKVTPRYRFWVVVFDKEDNRGNIDEMPEEEILNPYEFDMYPTTFEFYKKFQKWAATRKNSADMLDLENGFNVLATHGNKGVTLDRQEPSPIFDLKDPDWDKKIEIIWKRIKEPRIVLPSDRDLNVLADKIEEYAERRGRDERGGSGRGRGRDDYNDRGGRGRGRGRDDYNDRGRDDDRGRDRGYDDAPRSRRSRDDYNQDDPPRRRTSREDDPPRDERQEQESAPPPRRRQAEQEPQDREQDQQQQESAPPPRRRQEVSSGPSREDGDPDDQNQGQDDRRSAPPTRRRQEVSSEPSEERRPRQEVSAEELSQDQSNETPRSSSPPRRRQAEPEQNGDQPGQERYENEKNDGDLGPQKKPQGRGHGGTGVDENEDNAPEERRDPAPPTREKPAEEPPPVRSTGPAPKPTRDTGAMASRLRNINSREK